MSCDNASIFLFTLMGTLAFQRGVKVLIRKSPGKLAFLGAIALFHFFVGPTYPTTVEPLTVGRPLALG